MNRICNTCLIETTAEPMVVVMPRLATIQQYMRTHGVWVTESDSYPTDWQLLTTERSAELIQAHNAQTKRLANV